MRKLLYLLLFIGTLFTISFAEDEVKSPYGPWEMGPDKSNDYFPIGVWLQNPTRAQAYKKAGINTYIGLWKGPTEKQLAQLKQAGMKVICDLNAVAENHLDDPTIIGWMHGDEPDNAQSLGKGKGYGPPIPPAKIFSHYEHIKTIDATRPVLLNLGQGVAWDGWHGRGVRTNHPEDYPEYIKGCDIVSFDIYPAVHNKPQVAGKLWYVAQGVDRLVKWSNGNKIVWNVIECTRINHETAKATPHQVRAEVWMSLIHGSMGIIFFVHEWKPKFNEAALLSDTPMLDAVTRINHQIHKLAPVLNTPTIKDHAWCYSDNTQIPIALMLKDYGDSIYIFAVAMRDGFTKATIVFTKNKLNGTAEVLGEERTITVKDGILKDSFKPWDVHLYRIRKN